MDAAAGRALASARATLRAMTALLLLGTFTLTTSPEKLVEELSFLRQRRHGHFRPGGFLLAVLIALRLVPLLAEEMVRLRRARVARGAQFDRGGRRQRLADLRDLYAGYLAALLRRIDDMTRALEARGYRS
jgi:energy-coupling factor transport system permease protein